MKTVLSLLALAGVFQQPAPQPRAAASAEPPRPAPAPPRPVGVIGAPAGSGAYPAVAEVDAAFPDHTLYRPARLPKGPLPILVWGNGGCADNGLSASHLLREIASHGYLVVAAGHARSERPVGPPPALLPPPATPVVFKGPGPGRDETRTADLLAGIDLATAANAAKGGRYYRRLDTSRIAVGGHSCGGLQATDAAADPRIRTAMIFNSGIYDRSNVAPRDGIALDKTALAKLHTPMLYIAGGPTDIAWSSAADDVARIGHVPVFFGWLPVGHGGTLNVRDAGEYGQIATAWLDWQLRGDRTAAKWFTGTECRLCTDARWTVLRKTLG